MCPEIKLYPIQCNLQKYLGFNNLIAKTFVFKTLKKNTYKLNYNICEAHNLKYFKIIKENFKANLIPVFKCEDFYLKSSLDKWLIAKCIQKCISSKIAFLLCTSSPTNLHLNWVAAHIAQYNSSSATKISAAVNNSLRYIFQNNNFFNEKIERFPKLMY